MDGISAQNIANLIRSWWFINIGIPILAAIGGIFIKLISRQDKEFHFKRDDFVVGFDMTLGAVSIFFTKMVLISNEFLKATEPKTKQNLQDMIIAMPVFLLLWGIVLILISQLIRKWGWQPKKNLAQASETLPPDKTAPDIIIEPTIWIGIFLPLVLGFISLIFAVNWTGGEK